MNRKIFASRETNVVAMNSKNKRVEVYSFFPNDHADCECQKLVLEWKQKLVSLPTDKREALVKDTKFIVCPRDKTGMKRYKITCKNCGETLGFCWATDSTLKDFCDFHYVSWSDGIEWHGCLTPHISPITEQLCLECCCGQDTRDFRANMTLPGKIAYEKEELCKIGRDFGKALSKFSTRVVSGSVLPFTKEEGKIG